MQQKSIEIATLQKEHQQELNEAQSKAAEPKHDANYENIIKQLSE